MLEKALVFVIAYLASNGTVNLKLLEISTATNYINTLHFFNPQTVSTMVCFNIYWIEIVSLFILI